MEPDESMEQDRLEVQAHIQELFYGYPITVISLQHQYEYLESLEKRDEQTRS